VTPSIFHHTFNVKNFFSNLAYDKTGDAGLFMQHYTGDSAL